MAIEKCKQQNLDQAAYFIERDLKFQKEVNKLY